MPIPQFKKAKLALMLTGLALVAGCTSFPEAPSVMVLPGTNISLAQFNLDDESCRAYAQNRSGGTANQAAQSSAMRSAAIGTAVGTAAGAAIGGNRNSAGTGAGAGLLLGSAMGMNAAQRSGENTQRAYDNAYIQCMYAKGHRVPVSGNFVQNQGVIPSNSPPPPTKSHLPPPPPGNPPAPPPDAAP